MELFEKINLVRSMHPPSGGISKEALMSMTKGAVVKILDEPFIVTRVFNYQETSKKGNPKPFSWKEYQLTSLATSKICFLEVENDDQLLVFLTIDKISEGKFHNRPSQDKKQFTVEGLGGIFYLDEVSWANVSGEDDISENAILLDYKSEKIMIGVEIYSDDKFSAHTYKSIPLKEIEVVSCEN